MNPSLGAWSRHIRALGKDESGGKKLPAVVVLGAPPCIAFASAQKAPETLDELHLAGGWPGAINVVKARTVDLLVPAEAEIVVEGWIETVISRARGAVRRVPRPRQPAGIQRLHGGDLHHAPARRDPHFDHLAGHAERVEA